MNLGEYPIECEKLDVGGTWCNRCAPTDKANMSQYTIVTSHGMFCDAGIFDHRAAEFAALGYETFAPNARGRTSGKFVQRPGAVSTGERINDLKLILDAPIMRDRKIILDGHSLGALESGVVAYDNESGNIHGFVAEQPAPPKGVHFTGVTYRAMIRHLHTILLRKPLLPTESQAYYLLFNTISEEHFKKKIYPNLIPESSKALDDVTWGVNEFHKLDLPSLVIANEFDRLTTVEYQRKIAGMLGGELKIMPGCHFSGLIGDLVADTALVIHNFIQDKVDPRTRKPIIIEDDEVVYAEDLEGHPDHQPQYRKAS